MTRLLVVDNYGQLSPGTLGSTCEPVHGPISMWKCATTRAPPTMVLAAAYDAIVLSPGPCTAQRGGDLLELFETGAGALPIFVGVPGPPEHRPGLRRRRRGARRCGCTARRAACRHTGEAMSLSRMRAGLRRDALPFPRDRSRHLSRRSGDHRPDGRRPDHGRLAPHAPRPRRPVPPREHPLGARRDHRRELPRDGAGLAQRLRPARRRRRRRRSRSDGSSRIARRPARPSA